MFFSGTSGQTGSAQFAQAVLQSAVLGVLDNLMNYTQSGLYPKAQSAAAQALVETARNVIGSGTRAISISGPLVGVLRAIINNTIEQIVTQAGGWSRIFEKLEWTEPIQTEKQTLEAAHASTLTFLADKMGTFLNNAVVREYLAATTLSAMEGAAISMVLSQLGFGYVGETGVSVLAYAALRGALEGVLTMQCIISLILHFYPKLLQEL